MRGMRPTLVLCLLLGACPESEPFEPPVPPEADPGRVTLHRLNRAEYDNSVRDLLGLDLRLAADFPPDDHGYGFDNIADVLATSPLLLEHWAGAAATLAHEALKESSVESILITVEVEDEGVVATTGTATAGGWLLWANGTVAATVVLPGDATYEVSARVYGQQAGSELAEASLSVDGASLGTFDVAAASLAEGEILSAQVGLTGGAHELGVSFLNDWYDEATEADRNLVVDWIRVEGPVGASAEPNPIRLALLTCDPADSSEEACADEILRPLASRAWRRPATDDELAALLGLVQLAGAEGDEFARGIQLALQAILTSPHFVYRVELDPDPASPEPHDLSPWELASRLSYFLWSSMPDEVLFAAAEAGELATADQVAAQARRMLADPKADALTDNFAGQWLWIRAVDDVFVDPATYPGFDEVLRAAMKEEMRRGFETLLREDRSMLELLTGPQAWVNGRLTEHYDLSGTQDVDVWEHIDVTNRGRSGVLGQAGLQFATSQPTRSSPVRRGVWILEQLLCLPPGSPPKGVEAFMDAELEDGATQREVLEAHRADPVCASCHDLIDPLGFGLEHFDGIGAWREFEGVDRVDARGVLPDGREFEGAIELSAVLAADPDTARCMAEHLLTYGLGRGVLLDDREFVDAITEQFVAGEHRLEALVVAIATSEPFRRRRGEVPE